MHAALGMESLLNFNAQNATGHYSLNLGNSSLLLQFSLGSSGVKSCNASPYGLTLQFFGLRFI